ncbi:MAG: hypothetical protein ABIJ57_10985 [Pseudomonadota bacterium]
MSYLEKKMYKCWARDDDPIEQEEISAYDAEDAASSFARKYFEDDGDNDPDDWTLDVVIEDEKGTRSSFLAYTMVEVKLYVREP